MNKNLTIVFFGNTKYSIIGAQIIHAGFSISLFVTIPDQITGRKKQLTPSPVKELAQELNIPFLETAKLDQNATEKITKFNPDFIIVEDYGLILPQSILKLPKIVPLNVHHSLLPKYRGPSPAPTAILEGEKISGVTIIKMTEKVDAGDILAQREYQLDQNETTDSLLTQLNRLGGELAVEVMRSYLEDKINPKPQNDKDATFTKMIKKEDGYFDIDNPPAPEKLDRMIRAFYPWPNVWTKWSPPPARKGTPFEAKIVKFYPNKIVQMEGKKPVKLEDFLRGYPDFPRII